MCSYLGWLSLTATPAQGREITLINHQAVAALLIFPCAQFIQ